MIEFLQFITVAQVVDSTYTLFKKYQEQNTQLQADLEKSNQALEQAQQENVKLKAQLEALPKKSDPLEQRIAELLYDKNVPRRTDPKDLENSNLRAELAALKLQLAKLQKEKQQDDDNAKVIQDQLNNEVTEITAAFNTKKGEVSKLKALLQEQAASTHTLESGNTAKTPRANLA